jgi:cell division transport system permease protein
VRSIIFIRCSKIQISTVAKSLFKTSGSTISSVSTVVGITFVLLLVGLLLTVFLLGNSLRNHYHGQIVVQLMLHDEATENEILSFKKRLEGESYTAEVAYTSKEQAAEIMEEELGEEFIDFLGYNPLPASIDVKLNAGYNQAENLESLIGQWKQNNLVSEVVYQKDLLQQMNANLSKWTLALSVIGLLLLIIAIVLIVNTIELAVFSQRFLIKSMQLVGATHWFIQKPFLRRGLWYGFVSAVFALLILFGVLFYMRQEFSYVIEILKQNNRLLILCGGVIIIGLAISWLATAFAVRRFVRLETSKLY